MTFLRYGRPTPPSSLDTSPSDDVTQNPSDSCSSPAVSRVAVPSNGLQNDGSLVYDSRRVSPATTLTGSGILNDSSCAYTAEDAIVGELFEAGRADETSCALSRSTTPAYIYPRPHRFDCDVVLKVNSDRQADDSTCIDRLSDSGQQEQICGKGPTDTEVRRKEHSDGSTHSAHGSLLVPCLAVFSSNYNFTVTSIVLFLMSQEPEYRHTFESTVGSGTIKMLSYAGAIFGMCIMGYLGDLVGRRHAMIFTLSLVALGALGSSLFTWGSALSVAIILGVFRFVLGIGSGGVYPLSAVTAAEGTVSDDTEDRCLRVSWAYSMNVPGIIFPYVLALLLWWCSEHHVEICFRVLLGFGAIPAFLVWLPAWLLKDSKEYVERNFAAKMLQVFVKRSYWRQLIGTGFCWFLYDVTAYGILLVQPEITQAIWGTGGSAVDVIWQNAVLNAMGIPGCYMGILVIRQMGVKWLQFWGFMGLAGSSFLLAATSSLLSANPWAQLTLLAVVNFFINWGASITTFMLPSIVFPPAVRSTYSGISAAMGKIGAVAGIYSMKAILSSCGLGPMMVCAGLPSLLAAILTFVYVDPPPTSVSSAVSQCFGSLGACIPFIDCRRRKAT